MNVKALVGAFNQEKDLIGAFYVILKTDGSFAAVVGVYHDTGGGGAAQLPIHRLHPATRASAVTGTCCTLHSTHPHPQYANYIYCIYCSN